MRDFSELTQDCRLCSSAFSSTAPGCRLAGRGKRTPAPLFACRGRGSIRRGAGESSQTAALAAGGHRSAELAGRRDREVAVMAQEHARRCRQGFGRAGERGVRHDGRGRRAIMLFCREGFLHRLVADGAAMQLALQDDGDTALFRHHIGALVAGCAGGARFLQPGAWVALSLAPTLESGGRQSILRHERAKPRSSGAPPRRGAPTNPSSSAHVGKRSIARVLRGELRHHQFLDEIAIFLSPGPVIDDAVMVGLDEGELAARQRLEMLIDDARDLRPGVMTCPQAAQQRFESVANSWLRRPSRASVVSSAAAVTPREHAGRTAETVSGRCSQWSPPSLIQRWPWR